MEDLQSRITLAATMLKNTLEQCDLYLAVDSKTEEFLFIDREGYDNKTGKFGRVNMKEINSRK
ncbi:MAG: hypothetical protein ACRC18_06780 [Cetobacterium sp.]